MADSTITDTITCAECGRVATVTPLDWVRDVDTTGSSRRVRHLCPTCARTHLRAIEAGLDRTIW